MGTQLRAQALLTTVYSTQSDNNFESRVLKPQALAISSVLDSYEDSIVQKLR